MSKAIQYGAVNAMVVSSDFQECKPLAVEVVNASESGNFRVRVGDAEMYSTEALELARKLQRAGVRAGMLNNFGG